MEIRIQNYISGAYVHSTSGETFPNLCPMNGMELGQVGLSSFKDVDHAVQSAKKAFQEWSSKSSSERSQILWKAAQLIREQQEDLAKLESLDSGKPIREANVDIICTAEVFEFFAGQASNLRGHQIPLGKSFAYTRREALGVCAGIGAWNFPLVVASWKVAPALACGNTFVYKPSELTPMSTLKLAEILSNAGLPDGAFNVLQGTGSVGEALAGHPDVAKVSLTGSVATGKKVLKAVADKLIPVTLELGGKSPMILFDDCKLPDAVSACMAANFYCQGEICSNGTRVFVHESIYVSFLELLKQRVAKLRFGNLLSPETTIGALISAAHRDKVLTYIQKGKDEGAHLFCGGDFPQVEDSLKKGFFVSPTIFTECQDEMTIAKEEIFGPVLCVFKFKTEEEVLKRANNTKFGLGSSVFTQNLERAHRVASQFEAGICWINTHNLSPSEIPFGGYKESGLGRENGREAIDQYTQVKTVYVEMGDVLDHTEI